LRKLHKDETQQMEQLRKKEIETAFQSAQKLLKISPKEAVAQLDWLKSQTYPDESQHMKLDVLMSDAYYHKDFQAGTHLANSGDAEKALGFYQSALNRKETPEVKAAFTETRAKVFEQYLQKGTKPLQLLTRPKVLPINPKQRRIRYNIGTKIFTMKAKRHTAPKSTRKH
jgi:tetratricopeptide (TPR) repeat protein